MPFALVGLLSLVVGLIVYVGTIRRARDEVSTMGFGAVEPRDVDTVRTGQPSPGYAYLQISTEGPAPRDRLQGLFGLVLLVGVAAAALAFAIYEFGHLVNRTIEAFLQN